MFLGKNNMKGKKKSTAEIICQNLGVSYQTIFQDYKCTLSANISYFGRLYIGEEHLMFVSNMFGIVKKFAIIIDSISKLQEPLLYTIIINANIEKENRQQQFTFNGFKNQNAFKLIKALWKKEKLSSEVLNSNEQDIDPSQKSNIGKSLDEANIEINLFNPEIVQTQKQKMLEVILPCSVQQFFTFFISDNASVYPRKRHLQQKKGVKVVVSPWRKNNQMNGDYRQINAMIKVKGVPFKSQGLMTQIWLLQSNTNQQIKYKTITQMIDLPFSSYFHIEQQWKIVKQTQNKSKCICFTAVVFNKATYMKGTILKRSFQDLQDDYKIWTDNVKEILDKMKKVNEEAQGKAERKGTNSEIQYEMHKYESQKDLKQPKFHDNDLQRKFRQLEQSNQIINDRISKLTNLIYALMIMVGLNIFLSIFSLKGEAQNKTL